MSDYRTSAFDVGILTVYGKTLGKKYYWKIYAAENIIRVLIHSVLSVQVGLDWWDLVVDSGIRDKAKGIRQDYLNRTPKRNPGNHDIYCTYLSGLEKILFDNKGFFQPLVPKIDNIIIRLNGIRVPRNLTGHMNILNANDRRSITSFYKLSRTTIKKLASTPNFQLQYPV